MNETVEVLFDFLTVSILYTVNMALSGWYTVVCLGLLLLVVSRPSSYNLCMCKVQGDTDRLTILLLLSPVVLQEVAISSFRVNFGVTAFKHSKGPTYGQIQLDIHTDPTMHD